MINLAFVGECMLEQAANGRRHFGGDTLNSALYLARLSQNKPFQVQYATALGVDDDSDWLLSCWQQEGIDTQLVSRIPDKYPGRYQIQLDANGERRFSYDRADSAARYYLSEDCSPLLRALRNKQIDYLYLSGISLAILPAPDRQRLLRQLSVSKTQGLKIIFDNNYRPQLWSAKEAAVVYQQMADLTDIALITADDEQAVFGSQTGSEVEAIINRWSVPELVIKRGSQDAIAICEQVRVSQAALLDITVLDTSAAGDSFAAGYLAARLTGLDPRHALLRGHQLAAIVIQHSGAIIPASAMSTLVEQFHRQD